MECGDSAAKGRVLAQSVLLDGGVVVHPGSFYGMAEPERIVVSLIVQQEAFSTGICTMAKVAS